MSGYDFYDTEIQGISVLRDGAEVQIHLRDRDTMQSRAVRAIVADSHDKLPDGEKLYLYGRLGVSLPSPWYIKILEELEEEALATDADLAGRLDPEMQMGSAESFKRSRRMVH